MLAKRRALILLLTAGGAALGAVQIGSGPPSVFTVLAAEESPVPPTGAADEAGAPPSDAEVEAELRRAEEALGGKSKASEELPVKPLRADLPISLPSDI